MKRIIITPIAVTLGLLITAGTALAERPEARHGSGIVEHRLHVQQELGLSEEQMAQIKTIRESGGSREEINALLTSEQKAKMASIKESHKGLRKKRIAKMQKRLDLSDDQVKEIQEIREDGGSREDIIALLSDEQREKMKSKRRTLSTGG
ncbi:MAG: Spy/CpxP family protein refolding chaperone [Halioglobus sp.]|jgi:Spy/CpxP family protein refolding chaperone